MCCGLSLYISRKLGPMIATHSGRSIGSNYNEQRLQLTTENTLLPFILVMDFSLKRVWSVCEHEASSIRLHNWWSGVLITWKCNHLWNKHLCMFVCRTEQAQYIHTNWDIRSHLNAQTLRNWGAIVSVYLLVFLLAFFWCTQKYSC